MNFIKLTVKALALMTYVSLDAYNGVVVAEETKACVAQG